MTDIIYHMAFVEVFGLGTARCSHAYAHYDDPSKPLRYAKQELLEDTFLKETERKRIASLDLNVFMRIAKETTNLGYHIITAKDECFPKQLRDITPMPIVLYASGEKELLKRDQMITIVGTRNATEYGIEAAKYLGENLGKLGLIVVSGLAVGIDAAAHTGALQANSNTIAVIASGLDNPYPKENLQLRKIIEKNGLVLSEFPLGVSALRQNFAVRNRIISGLSLATIVVQAANKSGALITANHALEQGRDVFAVPGSIFDKKSEGCHTLLYEGAYIAHSAESIYHTIGRYRDDFTPIDKTKKQNDQTIEISMPKQCSTPVEQPKQEMEFDSPVHKLIYELLLQKPLNINDLCNITAIPIHLLMAEITYLEAMGYIECRPGRMYHAYLQQQNF